MIKTATPQINRAPVFESAAGYKVIPYHGEAATVFFVVDANAPEPKQPAIVASYRERWRAENHAITGRCGCMQNHHVHFAACEEGRMP